jgi:hypothetical protein
MVGASQRAPATLRLGAHMRPRPGRSRNGANGGYDGKRRYARARVVRYARAGFVRRDARARRARRAQSETRTHRTPSTTTLGGNSNGNIRGNSACRRTRIGTVYVRAWSRPNDHASRRCNIRRGVPNLLRMGAIRNRRPRAQQFRRLVARHIRKCARRGIRPTPTLRAR